MWELIRANKRKSVVLFVLMGVLLLSIGYFIGFLLGDLSGGLSGIMVASILWLILSLVSHFKGSDILLASSNAVKVTESVHPRLFNVVEEMVLAAGLSKMPEIYIIQSNALNAFATGRDPNHSAIAVTAGLLAVATRDELQGVVAHEMSHIVNRDIRFMTFAGIMLGTIVLISHFLTRNLRLFSMVRYSGSSGKNSGASVVLYLAILAIVLVFAILAPIVARLLYFAMSRQREYLADAHAVKLTRYPEGLASALEKISNSYGDLESANKVTAPMFIVNPLKLKGVKVRNLTSTHPPVEDRIKILRRLSGASLSNYQEVFNKVTGRRKNIIPRSGLTGEQTASFTESDRAATDRPSTEPIRRAAGNIVMTANDFRFLNCSCGMKFKIPPKFSESHIKCPRCGTAHYL